MAKVDLSIEKRNHRKYTNMKTKSKLFIAMALGLALLVSWQTTFAACPLSSTIQQKKVVTYSKKKATKNKSKKRTYRKTTTQKYSQKELNRIMSILEKKFLSKDKSPAWQNVTGFGLEANCIGVNLRWNTKEKQQEFCKYIYNSPAIKFGNRLDPVIDNTTGVSSYQGISIKAEKPVYPLNSTEIKFTLTNHSGKGFSYGEAYYMTARGNDGNWFRMPSPGIFNAMAYGLRNGESTTLTARLYPAVLPNKPGTYRFFHQETIEGKKVLLMATFKLK